MGNGQGEQLEGTNLRGRLSDVYFSALIQGALEPLAHRLGERATIDDPIQGHSAGLAEIRTHLLKTAEWLRALAARYQGVHATTGVDRDVTEGLLAVSKDGRALEVPVAVVAERHRSRTVVVRVYYSTRVMGATPVLSALAPAEAPPPVPSLVGEHLDALRSGDVAAALACFEEHGVARDAAGASYANTDGTLGRFHEKLSAGGWDARTCGHADDGRTVAVENTLLRVAGKDVAPQAGLMVYERGDSGLFRALRVYDEVTR